MESDILASLQFTGDNLAEVGEFLWNNHFEFDGSVFTIIGLDRNHTLVVGGTLHRHANGTLSVSTPVPPEPSLHERHVDNMKKSNKRKRGKKQ